MKPLFHSLTLTCLALLMCVFSAAAATLKVTDEGVHIEATGMGGSTLEYPKLIPKEGAPTHKAIETRIDGNIATIKYDGGGQIVVDVSDNSQIVYKFSGLPDDIKNYQIQMVVGLGQGPNRKWKFDDKEGDFPLEKPAKPHLYQGHSKTFTITNYENRTITFTVPEYSYQQLTDAREWGWSAFIWQFNAPYNKDWTTATIKVADGVAGEIKKVVLIDKFGQSTQSDWPNKVKSEEELKADVESEKAYYASLQPPPTDKFGGLPGSREKLGLQATGFFHVEQKNGRWLMVDPEGNAFFHLGICGFGPSDDYTLVKGREQIYEWLPSLDSEFKTAFKSDQGSAVISFHLANMIRKYGEPYSLDSYTARIIDRVRKFGFNSIGAFSPATANPSARAANFPYVSGLPLDQWAARLQPIPGIANTWDPFDEQNREKVEQSFAGKIPGRADDPLLIGYFLVNEPLYEDIPKVVPSLKGTFACKRRLVQLLSDKYKTIDAFNAAWGATFKSFDELNDTGLAVKTKAASEDMHEFYGLFMETYFQLVTETFRKYDKNHMLIGNRLQSGTINNEQLCRIMGKYVDVVSFNYYTYAFDKDFLTRIHKWSGGKPMMLSEFYWSSPRDSGMASRQDVSNQQERGLAYRNYVEHAAALGFVIGIEWFTLIDQATTGRWFSGFNGEAGNTGLF
ncbi:MAG: beta-galactosidase, partial [Armatimonadota bacterium]|nr:beta-galactosidase [Armatimonadota bacterium]